MSLLIAEGLAEKDVEIDRLRTAIEVREIAIEIRDKEIAELKLTLLNETLRRQTAEALVRPVADRAPTKVADDLFEQLLATNSSLNAEVYQLRAELAPFKDTSCGIGGYIDSVNKARKEAEARCAALMAAGSEIICTSDGPSDLNVTPEVFSRHESAIAAWFAATEKGVAF